MKLERVATFAQQRRDKKAQPRAKRSRPVKIKAVEPTPERQDKNDTRNAGQATQIKPVIETLFASDRLTTSEFIALNYYSEQANAAERSPIKSNLDKTPASGRDRPMSLACPYKEATERMERQMGFAGRTASAVCVDNYTLTQWAIDCFGGREHKGRIVPRRDTERNEDGSIKRLGHVAELLIELKSAAKRIAI